MVDRVLPPKEWPDEFREVWLTVRRAAIYADRSERTLFRWMSEGRFKDEEVWKHPDLEVWWLRKSGLDRILMDQTD